MSDRDASETGWSGFRRRALLSLLPVAALPGVAGAATGWSGRAEPGASPDGLGLAGPVLRPDLPMGAEVARLASSLPGARFRLLDDAGGTFSVSGDRLRLERPPGPVETGHSIHVRATGRDGREVDRWFRAADGLAVARRFPVPILARWNAADPSLLGREPDGSGRVARAGDPIGRLPSLTNNWHAVQPNPAERPTLVPGAAPNGKAGIRFAPDGAGPGRFLRVVHPDAAAFLAPGWGRKRFTVLMVVATDRYRGTQEVFSVGTASVQNLAVRLDGGGNASAVVNGNARFCAVPFGPAGRFGVYSFAANGAPDRPRMTGSVNGETPSAQISGGKPGLVGAIAPSDMWIGRATAGEGAANNNFAGTLLDLLVVDGEMLGGDQMRAAHRFLAEEWGLTLDAPAPEWLDMSQLEERPFFEDDFETLRATPPGTEGNAVGWTPGLGSAAVAERAGGGPANDMELCFHFDWRDPRVAPHFPSGVENSCLVMRARPMPPALAPLAQGKTWMGFAMSSFGWVEETYGYREWRVERAMGPEAGNFPALWGMNASAAPYMEQDDHEGFGGVSGAHALNSAQHSASYYPRDRRGFNAALVLNTNIGTMRWSDQLDRTAFLAGLLWTPEGRLFRYHNRRLVGEIPPPNGVKRLRVTDGDGSAPDSGDAGGEGNQGEGRRLLIGKAPGAISCRVEIDVRGGRVTRTFIRHSGARFTRAPEWFEADGTTPLRYGQQVTDVVWGGDPSPGPVHHQPLGMMVNNTLAGRGPIGPVDPALDVSRDFSVDYVRWYRWRFPAPATLRPGADRAFDARADAAAGAVIAAMGRVGDPADGRRAPAVHALVRALMAWELRHDRAPFPGIEQDWDPSKRSLWDAMDVFYLTDAGGRRACPLNWKRPGRHDLAERGAPRFDPGRGHVFAGAAGQYLESGFPLAGSQFNNADSALGVLVTVAPSGDARGEDDARVYPSLIGATDTIRLGAAAVGVDARHCAPSGPVNRRRRRHALAIGTGLLVSTRGYRPAWHLFRNGETASPDGTKGMSGYWAGDPQGAVAGTLRIGAHLPNVPGAAFGAGAAFSGRRLLQPEARKLTELLRAYRAAVGLPEV